MVVPLHGGPPPSLALVEDFSRRYSNFNTRRQYVQELNDLFASTGRTHPQLLTEADVIAWAGRSGLANNTIRNRLSRACTFLRWCVRTGEADPALVEALASRDNPLRNKPRLYGKVQGKYPARWLSHDEAFGALIATCDDSDIGLRNELLLRLGLGGMRAAEMIRLTVANLDHRSATPIIAWIGKASRARKISPGPRLCALLDEYLRRYALALGRPLRPTDTVLCREKTGGGCGSLSWGNRIAQTCSVRRIVLRCADAANLGHMSPHDLRRTAAGILHHTLSDDGGHRFDLLDIQKVLDHADPATTQRSYLDPLDTGVKQRAGTVLD